MSLNFNTILKHRRQEIIITIVLFIPAFGLVLLPLGALQGNTFAILGGKVGFSLLVALIVRLMTLILSAFEPSSEETDVNEYREAIKTARERIWIYQTWFPRLDDSASEIEQRNLRNTRILLLSCKPGSAIYSRITGRDITEDEAKTNSATSVKPFIRQGKDSCIRFNYGHHPAWIAVIDSVVFWGVTPIDRDSHAFDFLFHKHPLKSEKGRFWKKQFDLLWENYSHTLKDEKQYNNKL